MGATVVAVLALWSAACKSEHRPEAKRPAMPWRQIGSWSGHGDAQTDSFEIDFEQCRIRWETRNETSPGAGTFAVTVNSAVSGRVLAEVVDHPGVGRDVAYLSVDPHVSYLVIDSKNVDWSVTVEEPGLTDGSR